MGYASSKNANASSKNTNVSGPSPFIVMILIYWLVRIRADTLPTHTDDLHAQEQFLSQMLAKRVVSGTAYDDQGKRPCDSDTRIDILLDINNWVHDISDSAQRFLWLTGDPGSGKSAITASVARECKDENILWAQFFINRNHGNTTNPASYFPSIARQLAARNPAVALVIHDALKAQPSLMDDITQQQAGKIFVDSIGVASSTDPLKPVVIIIDALDETEATRLRDTAAIFSRALTDLPCNAKVFISSRTEDDIRKPFSDTFHVNQVKRIHLDTSDESSIRDVSTYLVRNMGDIVEEYSLDVVEWPGEVRLRGLCDNASGLFIWAETAVKFVKDQVGAYGTECLDEVLNMLNVDGMGDINVLYSTILDLTHRHQTDPGAFETFRRLVGCIVVLREPLCLAEIIYLLDLRNVRTGKPVDVLHRVRRLRTVLVAGTNAVDGNTVPRLHKSFVEYITSHHADPRFRVKEDNMHAEIASQCLRKIAILGKKDPRNTTSGQFPSTLCYALRFWRSHLPPAATPGVALMGELELLDLRECLEFTANDDIQPSFTYVALTSDGKDIVSSSDDIIYLHNAENGAHIRTFERVSHSMRIPFTGHSGPVCAVVFSPDGEKIISGSVDHTVRLWNASTGQPIQSPFEGHTSWVTSVAFSPDGNRIVSGSRDNTLRLWDISTGRIIGLPFEGHTSWVLSVAFSPDGNKIASGSADHTLCLWDVSTGRTIGSPFEGHTGWVLSVAFSPDGNKIASGSADHTLRLWDVSTGRTIGSPFEGHSGWVNAVAFSPSRNQIISGSNDSTLRLWDVSTGRTTTPPFRSHSNWVTSVAFSPFGNKIVSGSDDCSIRFWDLQTGETIGSHFIGSGRMTSVAFSPIGNRIVSGSEDGTVWLLDAPGSEIRNIITSLCISSTRQVASAAIDNTVRIWNAHTGQSTGLLQGIMPDIISLTSSPNGTRFAAASSDGSINLWDAFSHNLLASYTNCFVNRMSSIIFSADAESLMTFSIDGTSHIWDASSGKPIKISQPSHMSPPTAHRGECDKTLLRWFPVKNTDFGHWAYIDNTLIRRDRNGLMIILDMSIIKETWDLLCVRDLALPHNPDIGDAQNSRDGATVTINNIGRDQYNIYNFSGNSTYDVNGM
jgi:WD40 repeat protein